MSFHTIIIVGNLGRDPEMRYTPNGNAVTSLNVASNRVYTDTSGQRVKETTWFRVSVWGKQAENVNNYVVYEQPDPDIRLKLQSATLSECFSQSW